MTFERTHNLDMVRSILTESTIWPHVGDDFAPPADQWQPNDDPRIWYVLALEGSNPVGLFTFLPRSTVLWEGHIALLDKRRTHGREVLKAALRWMFEHSTAERIIGEIPRCNRLAVNVARRVMFGFGVNRASFMKHGVLQDLVLFGISKGEMCPAR